jgi:hypothetical protein
MKSIRVGKKSMPLPSDQMHDHRAARNALAYAESVMEANQSLAVTGRGF